MASSGENKQFPSQSGFPTPNTAPDDTACRVLSIPAQEDWQALIMGCLNQLRDEWRYWQNGDLTPAETATAMGTILDLAYETAESGQCTDIVEPPYWDDSTDVEETETVETQVWYGFVEDILAPPDGITFEENIALWAITGFIAAAGEIGGAVYFRSIAPRFVLAFKRGDVGEVIRIVVDQIDAAKVDTTSASEGDIVTVAVQGNPSLSEHDLYVMKVG